LLLAVQGCPQQRNEIDYYNEVGFLQVERKTASTFE